MNYHERLRAKAAKRKADMQQMLRDRFTLKEIAEKYGISYQRVQQILGDDRPAREQA